MNDSLTGLQCSRVRSASGRPIIYGSVIVERQSLNNTSNVTTPPRILRRSTCGDGGMPSEGANGTRDLSFPAYNSSERDVADAITLKIGCVTPRINLPKLNLYAIGLHVKLCNEWCMIKNKKDTK